VTSELLRIPGVGPVKRRALLSTFGSIQGIRDAAPERIAELPGFSLDAANKLLAALRASDPTAAAPHGAGNTHATPTESPSA
jgi:excinuclease ABC subunit C